MAGEEESKSSLSKNVLQMKFMKRSAIRIEKEKSAEEKKHVIDDEHWVLDLPETHQTESKFITEPSFTRCEGLLFGRMSFKGFNPEVEKLMKSENQTLALAEAERRENEINLSDKEMAQRYDSLVGTISKKFANKREKPAHIIEQQTNSRKKVKRQFQKPADD